MKIVVLDGYTLNPGDLSWSELEKLGECKIYDRTSRTYEEEIINRIGDAEIIITNKTPITKNVFDTCKNIKYVGVLATGYNVVDIAAAKEKIFPYATFLHTGRQRSVNLPLLYCLRFVTTLGIIIKPCMTDAGKITLIGVFGIIR